MTAERRQLTILNCDIVGSSNYADRMDPEDFEELLSRFFRTCNGTVAGHGGTVAHHTGDGILAYFGYPRTEGHDARDAIDCGQAIVDALNGGEGEGVEGLHVRIGIATGEVVLTDVEVQHARADRIAIGSAAHRSDRIQRLSSPGKISVDDTSRRLSVGYFSFIDRGVHKLRGFTEPSHVWEVGRPKPIALRFQERGPSIAPIVGRDRQLVSLEGKWEQVQAGNGQAVCICGEPGIGKSRLAFEFTDRIGLGDDAIVLQCLPGHEHAPLHPWANYIRHSAGVMPQDTPSNRRAKVARVLESDFAEHAWLHGFALQFLAPSDDERWMDDDGILASHKLTALKEALIQTVLTRSMRTPQVLVIEDLHWVDPTSRALLESLLRSIPESRILTLITTRPEGRDALSRWEVEVLDLPRLNAHESGELVRRIASSEVTRRGVIDQVVARSDGIPLYVEEMARAINEGEMLLPEEAAPADGPSGCFTNRTAIPDALQGTLHARLDSLGNCKRLAQVASVVGREFDLEMLAALAGRSTGSLENDLVTLVESGLVETIRSRSTPTLRFKHALVRDAAYNSLLNRDAVKLHGELARLYESRYAEVKHTHPEVVVRHLARAGRWLDAAKVWLAAGSFASSLGSTLEAMTRLNECLSCVSQAQPSADVDRIAMRCHLALGHAVNIHYGPADPKTREALDTAAALALSLDDTEALVNCLASLGSVKYNAGDFMGAEAVAERMVEIGEKSGSVGAVVKGLTNSGLCSFAMGRFRDAREDLERAATLVADADEESQRFKGLILVYLALDEHILGNTALAAELCEQALEAARDRPASDLVSTLGNSIYVHWMRGAEEKVRATAQELAEVSQRTGHLMWLHTARFFLGWIRAREGDADGILDMEASMNRFRDAGELVEQSMFYGILGEQCFAHHRLSDAVRNVDMGLDLVEQLSERFFEVPLLKLKVRCLEADGACAHQSTLR